MEELEELDVSLSCSVTQVLTVFALFYDLQVVLGIPNLTESGSQSSFSHFTQRLLSRNAKFFIINSTVSSVHYLFYLPVM